MIKPVLKLYKKVGETPLECLERFRAENPEYVGIPLTYAGRLDPLACGELLALTGEECKNREKYLGLNKTYRVKILFGVATDTHDVLGIVLASKECQLNAEEVKKKMHDYTGKFTQIYPDYSSKTIKGKSLFSLAKEGLLDNVEKPTKEVEIFNIKVLDSEAVSATQLYQEINEKINLVKGDFRQGKILAKWEVFFRESKLDQYNILEIVVDCSSGTYMRSLVDRLGKDLGCGAVAWEIERLRSY